MLADVMELKVEKADDDVQYGTGMFMRPMLVSERDLLYKFTFLMFRLTNICSKPYVHPMSYFVLFVH